MGKTPAIFFLACLGAVGCTYQSAVSVTPVYDVYSGYEARVPGTWALYVDGTDRYRGEADMVSFFCSAHNFPVDFGGAFENSLTATLGNLVEDLQVTDRTLTATELEQRGHAGIIIVKAEAMQAELEVNQGFWTGKPRSEVEMVASITVDGRDGRLLGTTVSGDGDARTSGGCGQGAEVIKSAAEDAMQDLLSQLGERLTNSQRVRQYATGEG